MSQIQVKKTFWTNRIDASTPNSRINQLPGYYRHRDNPHCLTEEITNVLADMLQIQQEGIMSEKRRVFPQFHMSH